MTRTSGTSEAALIPVGKGFAVVNREDVALVAGYTWRLVRTRGLSYARDSHDVLMHHRIIGHPANGMHVDHINGNGLDNRLCNLRFCSPAENSYNRVRPNRWVGVRRRGRKFAAYVYTDASATHLGTFDSREEAALVRDAAIDRAAGPFGARNFPVLISVEEAVRLLRSCNSHFFRVLFRRRADSTVRSMLCRCGVRLGTSGLGLAFEPRDRGLLPVWDARLKAHRFVNLLGVLAGIVDKTRFRVGPRARPVGATMERPEGLVHGH